MVFWNMYVSVQKNSVEQKIWYIMKSNVGHACVTVVVSSFLVVKP